MQCRSQLRVRAVTGRGVTAVAAPPPKVAFSFSNALPTQASTHPSLQDAMGMLGSGLRGEGSARLGSC